MGGASYVRASKRNRIDRRPCVIIARRTGLARYRADVGKYEHIRIRCKSGRFFLNEQSSFLNLYVQSQRHHSCWLPKAE